MTVETVLVDDQDDALNETAAVALAEAEATQVHEGEIIPTGSGQAVATEEGSNLPAKVSDDLVRLQELAELALMSGKYPDHSGFELMMKAKIGQELGLGPATSFEAITKIKDGFNLSAELQRALVRRAGYRITEIEISDTICTLALMNEDLTKEYGRNTYRLEDAQKAKLLGNEVWHKYRKAMMRARCSTELIAMFCPEIRYWAYGTTL